MILPTYVISSLYFYVHLSSGPYILTTTTSTTSLQPFPDTISSGHTTVGTTSATIPAKAIPDDAVAAAGTSPSLNELQSTSYDLLATLCSSAHCGSEKGKNNHERYTQIQCTKKGICTCNCRLLQLLYKA